MGGPALSLDSLARLTETTPRGTSLGALARAAARLGHQLEVRRFTPPIPLNDVLPMIAWVGGSHFVAVAGRSDRGVHTILDPQLGTYRMPEAAFAREWHGEALVPRPLISASGGAP